MMSEFEFIKIQGVEEKMCFLQPMSASAGKGGFLYPLRDCKSFTNFFPEHPVAYYCQ